MDLFAPHNLPGVGMGDLASVAGVCGLIGLAVTSGLLVAEGVIGTVVFILGAISVLAEKHDFGGAQLVTWIALGLLLVLAVVRLVLERTGRGMDATLRGAAADAPATKATRARIARDQGIVTALAMLGVLVAGAASGFAWAEWNEVPFRLGDTESWVGLGVGLVAGAIGGDAAWRFVKGAVRAGGSATIVGVALCVVALVANSLSVYVPFVGAVVLLVTIVLAVRLRRRDQKKYAGLRILS